MSDEGSSDTTAAQDQRNSLKDVLRELLQEEPSLLAPAVEAAASRAPPKSTETKENPPGKSHTAIHVGGVPYHAAGGGEMDGLHMAAVAWWLQARAAKGWWPSWKR